MPDQELSARVSVVLPVHAGVAPAHVDECLRSIAAQTRPADEVVIVVDGPLRADHEDVLAAAAHLLPLVMVRLPTNQGPGVANQTGLLQATGTWIVKVDADDVLFPERIERQLTALVASGDDLCGAAMVEFEQTTDHVTAVRSAPLGHDDVLRRLRINNPVNHPTATYRREAALAVGGYPVQRYMEDYVLMVRLVAGGFRIGNLAEPLVWFRADDVHHRRRAPDQIALDWSIQRELRAAGLTTRPQMLVSLGVRTAYRRLPPVLLRWAHQRVLGRSPRCVKVPSSPPREGPSR